jgi:hypothetical protein
MDGGLAGPLSPVSLNRVMPASFVAPVDFWLQATFTNQTALRVSLFPPAPENSRSDGTSGIPWVGSPTFREIKPHQNADKSYKDEGVALLDLARNAQRLFANQEPREKRRLLNFIPIELHLGGWRSGRDLPSTL